MKNIVFLNTCKIQDWASDNDKEFRLKANEFIIKIVTDSPLFSDNESISIEYYQDGISSMVSKIILPNKQKFVFKTNSRSWILQSEIISLQKWAEIGIAVPKIYESGQYNNYPYYIMDCFEDTTLKDTLEGGLITAEETGIIIGSFFSTMQKVTGQGFGRKISEKNGKLVGPQVSLSEYIYKEFNDTELLEVLLSNDPKTQWQDLLARHIENINKNCDATTSVLGNFDMGPRHIFATQPPTLFDPLPELSPRYFDIAAYLIPENGTYVGEHYIRRKATVDSYPLPKEDTQKQIIYSAIWLLTFRKCANLLQKTNDERTSRAQHMISIIGDNQSFDNYIKLYFN